MNLLQLRQRCRSRFRDIAQQYYDDAEWNAYLNEAQMDVIDSSPWWPFFEAHVDVTLSIGGPSFLIGTEVPDAARLTYLYNKTINTRLKPLFRPGEGYGPWPTDSAPGPVLAYQIEGDRVTVYPSPDMTTVLEVGYVGSATTEMSNDGDVPVVPERYHRMLIDGAMARAYTDDGNMEQSQAHQARFDRLLAAMQYELLSGREDRHPQFVDDFWS